MARPIPSTGFESAVDVAVARIEEDPIQFPVFRDEIRWIRLKRFPHVLYFLVLNDTTVEILAVAHGMRRPSYWIRRAKRR